MPEILRLVGTIENKITKDRNGYNLTYNIVKNAIIIIKWDFQLNLEVEVLLKTMDFYLLLKNR